jgi:hypothetical protein
MSGNATNQETAGLGGRGECSPDWRPENEEMAVPRAIFRPPSTFVVQDCFRSSRSKQHNREGSG